MQKIHKNEFPNKIFFYTTLHQNNVTFNDLIRLAKKRISSLKSIETLKDARIMDMNLTDDELSHFACRLICCNVPWAFSWFLSAELKLFKARLKETNPSDIKNFFYTLYLKRAKNLVIEDSILFINPDTEFSEDNTIENHVSDIYTTRVHFTKAPDVLRDLNSKIVDGYFTLDHDQMKKVIINEFHEHLVRRMNDLKKNTKLKTDERFQSISSELFTEQKSTSNQIGNIINKSPPCINIIIKKIRTEKHLKFNDRQILTRYFKSCGLSVADCIDFFKGNFSCDPARFEREFVYSIRHNYGLEGKRADYKSFTCMQIIGMNSCPFVSTSTISEYLNSKDLVDIEDAVKKEVSNRNFTKACTEVCEYTNKKEKIDLITTPVEYFKISK